MNFLYLDCFAGISGDMFLGALIDLGISPQELADRLETLGLHGFRLAVDKISKNGISATKASVQIFAEKQPHRHLSDILQIIEQSLLPTAVKEKSTAVFRTLAAAEAKVHGVPVETVHFHEVGALDSIIDIIGTVTALDMLGIEHLLCSPLPLGSGFVECAHGTLPLPAPAVLELLKGIPTRSCNINGETVTPTGAALVKTLSAEFGTMPAMKIAAVGYGAGTAERAVPNLVRAILGETTGTGRRCERLFTEDTLHIVEANIDDMNPEFYDYIVPFLFSTGAVDVFITPVIMKKGRPAQVLSCLVPDDCLSALINALLAETTTLGVRTHPCRRYKLARESKVVQTRYGPVTVKLGRHPDSGHIMNIAPEWEDCKAAAYQSKIPVKTVYDLAKAEAYKSENP